MLKIFSKIYQNNSNKFHKFKIPNFYFGTKSIYTEKLPLPEQENLESYVEDGKTIQNVKVYNGIYPYMPLDDHPLIPGYARIIGLTMELTEKLKELNVEKTKLVVSVLKNPEKVEALQASM